MFLKAEKTCMPIHLAVYWPRLDAISICLVVPCHDVDLQRSKGHALITPTMHSAAAMQTLSCKQLPVHLAGFVAGSNMGDTQDMRLDMQESVCR